MDFLVDEIRSAIVYKTDAHGKVQQQRAKGSSIDLPELNHQETQKRVAILISRLLIQDPAEKVLSRLKAAVLSIKSFYTQTHDGFRVAKGSGLRRKITIGDVYAFSTAAGYCLDFIPATKSEDGDLIGIGVMAPAIQDCGKNLIKLIWKAAGYNVLDLGNSLRPEAWLEEIEKNDFSGIAISCMSNKCVGNVQKLLHALSERKRRIPVIIGGIAVNRVLAYDLGKSFNIPVHYGTDVNDAVDVLQRALSGTPVEIPIVKEVEALKAPTEISETVDRLSLRLFQIRISDIVIDQDARRGCTLCSGDKRRLCPLEIGYEKEKSLGESTRFINHYGHAVLVFAETPDESNRPKCKELWQGLLRLEQFFHSVSNEAFAFKFPMTCPFCLPKECRLSKGNCVFPFLYRQLHEQYNINIPETLYSIFGDSRPPGICSIILVR